MLEKEIIELRKEIESKLKKVNLKERIKIDTEILENLIFKIVPIPGENKEGKVIAWEGKFLSKIDLSELSFDNVILPGYAFDLGARYYDNKTYYTGIGLYYIDTLSAISCILCSASRVSPFTLEYDK